MKYNMAVIGAGPGGYVCAIKAAKLGLSVAVVEDREVGGTCLNRGCIPAKALLHSAELYSQLSSLEKFGIGADNASVDIKKVFEYKEKVSARLRGGVEQLFLANGIDLYRGRASIGKEKTIIFHPADGGKKFAIEADHIVIATGSVPGKIPVAGIDLAGVLNSDALLSMEDEIPESLVIIGGGVISVEFAQVYSSFGTKVMMIEAMPRILPMMDREISRNLTMILKQKGVDIRVGASVKEIRKNGEQLGVFFVDSQKQQTAVFGDKVLVAVGRNSNTEGLFEKDVTVGMERGKILVDASFQTTMEGVYAIGDVIPSVQLAHVASAQGIFLADFLAKKAGKAQTEEVIDLNVIPSCVYTNPEIACVGITQEEAKEQKIAVKIGKFITMANGKSIIADEERGFVKLVFREEDGILLGAQLMCARATEMIGEMATAIANKLTAVDLMRAMRAHPTVYESIGEAVEDFMGGAIHAVPKKRR